MAKWKTHKEWAKRYLEWDESDYREDLEALITFPKRSGFLTTNHDYNRRAWRDYNNRMRAYNTFGEKGLEIMDVHYCLDFLKEETDLKKIQRQLALWKIDFSIANENIGLNFYPRVKNLARYLAGKIKDLNINKKIFRFIIVNFREILSDLIHEHGYKPNKLEDWNDSCFNELIEELRAVANS